MLIIGAGGHAKEVLEILCQNKIDQKAFFFDNTPNAKKSFLDRYPILSSNESAIEQIKVDPLFVSAISGTESKEKLINSFIELGGVYHSILATNANVGRFDVILGKGLNIMQNVFISNNVKIGDGCLLNFGASIHHDCSIGRFCEISPQAQLLGGVQLEDYVSVGAGAIVLPRIKIGKFAVIGAGAVVTKDVPENVVVVGSPARIIQKK